MESHDGAVRRGSGTKADSSWISEGRKDATEPPRVGNPLMPDGYWTKTNESALLLQQRRPSADVNAIKLVLDGNSTTLRNNVNDIESSVNNSIEPSKGNQILSLKKTIVQPVKDIVSLSPVVLPFNISLVNIISDYFPECAEGVSGSNSLQEVTQENTDASKSRRLSTSSSSRKKIRVSGKLSKPKAKLMTPYSKSTMDYGALSMVDDMYGIHMENVGDRTEAPEPPAKLTILETISNLVSLVTGSGMLALPAAASLVGWTSLLCLVVLASMFIYMFALISESIESLVVRKRCGALVDNISNAMDKNEDLDNNSSGQVNSALSSIPSNISSIDYTTLGKAAFGKYGDVLVGIVLAIELLLALTSFMINISVNMRVVYPNIPIEFGILATSLTSCVLSTFDLHKISYTSAIGVSMTALVIISIFIAGNTLPSNSSMDHRNYNYCRLSGLPMALGLISFCFGGHGAYPKIYVNMAERGKYGTVLIISGLIIIGIYAVVLCLGYYYYAQHTRLLITENIGLDYNNDNVSHGNILRVVAAIGIIFNLQFTCPLVTFPLRHMASQVLNSIDCVEKSSCAHTNEKFLSFGIIALATAIAMVLRNNLGAVITLIGSICTITNSIFLPIAFFHFLHPISLVSPFRYAAHIIITVLAVIIVFIGMASSLCGISAQTLSVCSYFSLTRQ